MSSGNDKASLHSQEDDIKSQNERLQGMGGVGNLASHPLSDVEVLRTSEISSENL